MTVVPRQSTTTSARAAFVRLVAPSAVIRPFSASSDSTSPRGAARTPVTSAPMLISPSVATLVLAEAAVDGRLRARPVVGAKHARVHHRLRGGVEHLVLELPSAELRADEVPDELEELDPLARLRCRPTHEPLDVGARLRARERGLRRRQLLEGAAGQLADGAQHVDDQPALQAHAGIDVLRVRARHTLADEWVALRRLHDGVERRAQRRDVAAERSLSLGPPIG